MKHRLVTFTSPKILTKIAASLESVIEIVWEFSEVELIYVNKCLRGSSNQILQRIRLSSLFQF